MRWVVLVLAIIWSIVSINAIWWSFEEENQSTDLPPVIGILTVMWIIFTVSTVIVLSINYW